MGLQGTIMAGPLYCPFRQPTCNVIWACSELDRARDQHRYFAPAATVYGSAHAKGQRSALCTPRPLQHSPLRDFPALCSFHSRAAVRLPVRSASPNHSTDRLRMASITRKRGRRWPLRL